MSIELKRMIHDVLELQPYWGYNNVKMDMRGKLIEKLIPQKISALFDIHQIYFGNLKIVGSNGKGRKSRIPVIRIFLQYPSIDWDVILLFSADGSGVYISLNYKRGATNLVQKAREAFAQKNINIEKYHKHIALQDSGARAKSYEKENVVALSYLAKGIPSDTEVIQEIIALLRFAIILAEDDKKMDLGTYLQISTKTKDRVPLLNDKSNNNLEAGMQNWREGLSKEYSSALEKISYSDFEGLVVVLLLAMGYGGPIKDSGLVLGKPGDGGIDGVIKKDPLGLELLYFQAKRWAAQIRETEIHNFIGALESRRADKGVFVTTSSFTKGAAFCSNNSYKKIRLIDGRELISLMIDYKVGVKYVDSQEFPVFDTDYFCEQIKTKR